MTRRHKKWAAALLLTVLSISSKALANPPVIVVDDKFSQLSIGSKIEYWEDETASADVEQAAGASASFKPSVDSVPNFGYTKSAYWFRFALSNESKTEKHVVLEVGYPLIDKLTSCSKSQSQDEWSCNSSGDSFPFSHRELLFRNVTFSYEVKPGQQKDVYLRAETTSSMRLPLWLQLSTDFQHHIISGELAFGLLFGWLIVMLLYNSLLGLITRDALYFYYSLFVAGCILFVASMSGHAFQFLWPNATNWASRAIPTLIGCFSAASVVFSRFFLSSSKKSPRLDKVLIFLLLGYFFVIALSLVGPIRVAIRVAMALVFAGAVFLMIHTIFIWIKGYKPARFFAFGWLFFTSACVMAVLRTMGWMPEGFISEQCLNIGAGMLALLIAFANGDRLRLLIRERQTAREAQLALASERFHNFSEIQKITDYVSSVSDSLTRATTNLVSSGEEVTSSVNDVSNFADDLADMVSSIKTNTRLITNAAQQNMNVARETTRAMEDTNNEVSYVKNDSDLIFETSEKLITSLSDLDDIVSSVGSIAEQSKILAVNASIESASAGEYGTGFSVIAQEVKNLAQESKEATVEIGDMLSVFKESITDIIQMTRSSAQKTEDSRKSIQHVLDLALVLSRAIEDNVTMSQKISSNLQKHTDSIDHIIKEVSIIEGESSNNQSIGNKINTAATNLNDIVNHLLSLVSESPH